MRKEALLSWINNLGEWKDQGGYHTSYWGGNKIDIHVPRLNRQKFYRRVIRSTILCVVKYWLVKNLHAYRMRISKIKK